MRSELWNSIKTSVRTKVELPKGILLLTEKQWLQRGYKPSDADAGQVLWTNQHCQVSARYLFIDEIRALTKEENITISAEKKAHAREHREKLNREAEEKKAQLEKEIKELSKENSNLECTIMEMQSNLYKNCTSIIRNAVETILSDRTSIQSNKVVVLDVETTGLLDTDELLQISIIDTDGNIVYNNYIRPLFHTEWPQAEGVNNISSEMVKDSPTLFKEARKIADAISDAAAIIGYNVSFDLNALKRFGIPINPEAKILDVSVMFAPIFGEWSDKYEDFKFQKLTTCAAFYGYEWELNAHNSLADCLATLHCYKKMVEKNQI